MTAPAADVPRVPGYRTDRLLGFGAAGEVWAATDEDDGSPVALKVLRVAGEETDRVLRETALQRRVEHPHVVRLRTVAHVPGAGPVLVLDRAVGGSLAALVAARGPLDVGEVVTLLTPLAGALTDLHERGLVHGDVAPGNVLFDDRGRPLLGDLGVARVVGEGAPEIVLGTPGFADPAVAAGSPPAPSADVHGLAAVGWFALTGHAPGPPGERSPLTALAAHVPAALAELLEEGMDPDPSRRPDGRELASRCFDTAPATPVRLVPTDPAAAPAEVVTHRLRAAAAAALSAPTPERRRRVRLPRAVLSGLVVVALAAALGGGMVAGRTLLAEDDRGTEEQVAPTRAARSGIPSAVRAALTGEDPLAAVPALAWLRARGLTTADADLLARAGTTGGAALARDLALLDALQGAGVSPDGLGFDVRSATLVSRDGDRAVVDATVVTLAHRHVDAGGRVVREVPEAAARTSRLVLLRVDGAWRVERLE